MNKVKNGRCISQISIESLKSNKTGSVVLIIAIALTTLLITSLFIIGGSMIKSIEQSTMYQVGTSTHGGFKFIDREQYEKLCEDSEVKDISYNVIVGFAENKELQNNYTEIRYTEAKSAEWGFSMPQKGRLPQKSNELAVASDVLDALGIPHELGQTVHLEFSVGDKYYSDDFVLCGYWDKPAATMANQAFVSREYQQKIAPEWKSEADRTKNTDTGCVAGSINPSLWFDSSVDIESQMQELKTRCGFGDDVNDGVNWAYTSSTVDFTSILLMSLILIMVIISGYLIIYNVFYISISADIRFYGLLKTIGTTGKQLKKIVYRQALILSFIGIPLGLIAGYLLGIILFPVITGVITDIPCKMTASPVFFAISAAFSLATVLMSCMRPCRMLKKLSPVEAVRYEQDQLTGKKHKKTVLVVLSLALSIILFNSTVAVVKGFDMDKYIESFAVTDFVVTSSSIISQMSLETDTKAISQETAKALNNTPGLTDSGMVYMDESEQNLDSKALERTKAIFNERKDDFVTEDEKAWIKECIFKNNWINSHVYGISDFIYGYTEIAKGEFDADKFESGKYAVVSGYDDTGKYRYYDIGDTIKVDFADGTTKSYEVMAIGDITYALSVQHGHGMDISILLPEKEYLEHSVGEDNAMLAAFNVNDIEFDKAQEYVSAYCESSDAKLGCKSKKDYIDSFHSMELMYLIVGGALSFIIGLIGILNFINMTITSINTRRRELAVLQAVGMTDKQMRKMLVKEGVNKILLTFAFVITIGSVVSMAIVKLITMEMWMFTYHFTVWPVFVSMPVFLIIAVIVPELVHKRMKKSSLTARLADNV